MWLAASSFAVPDGVLATLTTAQLSGKPHQGVQSRNPASHPGIGECNSTAAIGLRASLALNGLRQSERARYYGSALGRFTSPDPYNISTRKDQGKTQAERKSLLDSFISNPQSWNRNAYALNAPLHLVDVGGNCSAPAGLKPGQTGVCIEAFIAAPRIGGIGLGDNRSFSASGGTYRFRVDVRVDPGANGNVSINKDAGRSQIGAPSLNIGLRGTGDAQIGAVIPDEQGNRQSDVTGEAINGFQRFTGLGPQGAIQLDLSFTSTPSGSVSLDMAQGTTYPSLEIYTYDSNGKLTGTLLKSPEQQPSDLQKPMAYLGGKDCPK